MNAEGIPIREFVEGAAVEGFYALQEAHLLTASNGKPYLRIVVSDTTGTIVGNLWEGGEEIFRTLKVGGVVKLRAAVESYRGTLQLKIVKLRRARDEEIDPKRFLPTSDANLDILQENLFRVIEAIEDDHYRALLHVFFDDAVFCQSFRLAPAAKQNHHAYLGGLLEHTMSVVNMAQSILSTSATSLDRDLLLTSALLHDIGKVEELGISAIIEYTDVGRLVGHVVLGAMLVSDRCRSFDSFPPQKRNLLLHMILSHHGKREFGSPVLPAIPEAFALHYIDNLDAKIASACKLIAEDSDVDRHWTPHSSMHETPLYKGMREEEEGESRL